MRTESKPIRRWTLDLGLRTVLGLGLWIVLACGPAPAAAPAPAAVEQPRSGGVLNLPVSNEPRDWDLTSGGKTQPGGNSQPLAYNSLLGYKYGPGVDYMDLILRPELAQRWEVSPDAKTFTFHLRQGVMFAPLPPVNGRELTSADVKWSYEYWARSGEFKNLPPGEFRQIFEGMEEVRADGPNTAVVRFKEPYAPFLHYSASDYNPIVPKEIYLEDGHLKDRIVGTGPFQLDVNASQKGTRLVWKKNANYWETGKPYIDEVRMLILRDRSAAAAAFQTKQIDWIEAETATAAKEIEAMQPAPVAFEYMERHPQVLYLNSRRAPMNDVRVRRAFSLAVDRDEYLQVLNGGKGGWALNSAPAELFTQQEIRQMLRHDPEAARKLLAEAGFPDGLDIELPYAPAISDKHATQHELLQAQFKKAGIRVTLKPIERVDLSAQRDKGDFVFHLYPISTLTNFGDVDGGLHVRFHPDSSTNYHGFKDLKVAELLAAQRREPDPDKRLRLLRNIAKYISVEMVYGTGLYYGAVWNFWHPHLRNYRPQVGTMGWPIVDSWLSK